jgi:hypothetical protein
MTDMNTQAKYIVRFDYLQTVWYMDGVTIVAHRSDRATEYNSIEDAAKAIEETRRYHPDPIMQTARIQFAREVIIPDKKPVFEILMILELFGLFYGPFDNPSSVVEWLIAHTNNALSLSDQGYVHYVYKPLP